MNSPRLSTPQEMRAQFTDDNPPEGSIESVKPATLSQIQKCLYGNERDCGYLYKEGDTHASIEVKLADWIPNVSSDNRKNFRMGLFAKKRFKKHEAITPYAGNGLFVTPEIFEFPELVSHFKILYKIERNYYVIDGFKEPRPGFGLGQFANDKRDMNEVNATMTITESDAKRTPIGAYLVASKDIAIGEEILIDYGETYWENAKPRNMSQHSLRKIKNQIT